MARIVNETDAGLGGINQNGTFNDGSVFGSNNLLNTGKETIYFDANSASSIELPSSSFVTDAQFIQTGSDLHLVLPSGETVVIEGYFAEVSPPALKADGGVELTPELVQSFLTPVTSGQVAQVIDGAAGDSIGSIDFLSGQVFATRVDGTKVELKLGDPVYQGDQIETNADGSVKMKFVDETIFTLGEDARLALDELVFDASATSGSSAFSILKGSFVFVSGQIAHDNYDNMEVSTPVATIGIRGTTVTGSVLIGDTAFTFSVLEGSIAISAGGETISLSESFSTAIGERSASGRIEISQSTTDQSAVLRGSNKALSALGNSDLKKLESAIKEKIKEETGQDVNFDLKAGLEAAAAEDEAVEAEKAAVDAAAAAKSAATAARYAAEEAEAAEEAAKVAAIAAETKTAKAEAEAAKAAAVAARLAAAAEIAAEEAAAAEAERLAAEEEALLAAEEAARLADEAARLAEEEAARLAAEEAARLAAEEAAANPDPDPVFGTSGDDILTGTDGNDTITAGDGNDTVISGAGDDTIIGGTGNGDDYYNGGTGTDTLKYDSVTTGTLTAVIGVDVVGTATAFGTTVPDFGSNTGDMFSTVTDGSAGIIDNDVFTNIETLSLGSLADTVYVHDSSFSQALMTSIDGKAGNDAVVYQDGTSLTFNASYHNATATNGSYTQTLTNIETIASNAPGFSAEIGNDATSLNFSLNGNVSGTNGSLSTVTEFGKSGVTANLTNDGTLVLYNSTIGSGTIDSSNGTIVSTTSSFLSGTTLKVGSASNVTSGSLTMSSGSTLLVDAGQNFTIGNTNALEFASGSTLTVNGTITNTDTSAAGGTPTSVTVNGSGQIDNTGTLDLSSMTTSVNFNNTGVAKLQAGYALANTGLYTSTGSSSNLRLDGNNSISGSGTINVTGNSSLTVNGTANLISNEVNLTSGTLDLTSSNSTLTLSNGGTFDASSVINANGSTGELKLSGSSLFVHSGNMTIDNSLFVKIDGSTIDITNGTLNGSSHFQVMSGGTVKTGTNTSIGNTLNFDMLSGSTMKVEAGETFTHAASKDIIFNAGSTLTVNGLYVNQDTSNAALKLAPTVNGTGTVSNTGSLTLDDTAFTNVTVQNSGSMNFSAASGSVIVTSSGTAKIINESSGALNFGSSGGADVQVSGSIVNSGAMTVNGSLAVNDTLHNDGSIAGGTAGVLTFADTAHYITSSWDNAGTTQFRFLDFGTDSAAINAAGSIEIRVDASHTIADSNLNFMSFGSKTSDFHDINILNSTGTGTYYGSEGGTTTVGMVHETSTNHSFQLKAVTGGDETSAADQTLTGTSGSDVFVGGSGNDTASSGSGGMDVFYGGAGNDTFNLNTSNFGNVNGGFVDGGSGGMDVFKLDGADINFNTWQVNNFEVLDISNPQLAGGFNPVITEDLVLGMTEDQNSQLETELGASANTKNALILYSSGPRGALFDSSGGGEFADTGSNVTLTTFGTYNGTYSIYSSNDARLYVLDGNITNSAGGG